MGHISELDCTMESEFKVKTEPGEPANKTHIKVAVPDKPVFHFGKSCFPSAFKRPRPDPDSEESDSENEDEGTLDSDSNVSYVSTPNKTYKRACTVFEKVRKAHGSLEASYTEMSTVLNLTKELKEECKRAEEVAERERKAKAAVQKELRESIVRAGTLEGKVGVLKGEIEVEREEVRDLKQAEMDWIYNQSRLEAELRKGNKKTIMALEDKLKRVEREHEITKKKLIEEIDKSGEHRRKHLDEERVWLNEKGKYQGDLLERDKEINRLKVELEMAKSNGDKVYRDRVGDKRNKCEDSLKSPCIK